jgi:hypothetical protein
MLPILLALAITAIVFVILLIGQPDEFKVVRCATIAAPPPTVFGQVNDFHKWEAWSPWAKLDPACKNTFSGAATGKDAGFAWDGNKKVGAGRMTILESQSPELIRINLEFLRPFKTNNVTEFTFRPQANQTLVAWTMTGKQNFICKIFGLFMDGDKMVGKDFEKGLAGIKAIVEGAKS